MSSIGNSGARSCGPMGCPVPGWSGGGSGVLRSAWMLYHLVGSSFSESRYFVVMSAGFRAITDLLVFSGTRLGVRRAPQNGGGADGGLALAKRVSAALNFSA